jgi:hypothetical protein
MIFKVHKHRSKRHLRVLVRYLLSRKNSSKERVLWHESLNALPMLPGESAYDYAKHWAEALWRFTAQARGSRKAPEDYFVHAVMSFFPGNGQHGADQLTAAQAVAIAKEAMAEVASGERQVLYVVHGDTAHLHVHIAFSVVDEDGRIWNPHHDFRLWEGAAARLEAKHGLYEVRVGRAGYGPTWKKSPTTNELNRALRTEQPSDRMALQQLIDAALAGNPAFPVFWQRLLDAGVTPIPNIASTGRVSGMSFRYGAGLQMKGSDLGKGYSWGSLAKQVHFAASQHLHLLKPFVPDKTPIDGAVHISASPQQPQDTSTAKLPTLSRFVARPGADQRINWVWRNKPSRTAFVESSTVCLAKSAHQSVHEAMAERCKQRGLQRVGVTGSEVFCRRMWFELSLRGVNTVGYEPTDEDKHRLEWWINEQASDGGENDPAEHPRPDKRDGHSAIRAAGRNAQGEGIDERGVGKSYVSAATGDDVLGARKSSAAQGMALSVGQRDPAGKGGNGRVAIDDGGSENAADRSQTGPESKQLSPTPYLWRASRLGKAALLRQGLLLPADGNDCRAVMETVEALDRRLTKWSITFGPSGQAQLGQLSRYEELALSWSNLQVLNSLGNNVRLELSSQDSWLHLVGVTSPDLQKLEAQGITPTAQFMIDGVTQVFVHVNHGHESPQIMKYLNKQIQVGLDAQVRSYVGSVSFPVGGFDYWLDGELHTCGDVRFDTSTIGAQFTKELQRLKGGLGVSRVLGAPPERVLNPDSLDRSASSNANHDATSARETPRPTI